MITILLLLSTSSPLSILAFSSHESGTEAPQKVPPTNYVAGPRSVLVILVRFKDTANTKSRDEIKDLVFTRLNNYFKEVSYGAVWLTGDVTSQWYQLSRSRSYYGTGMASSEKTVDLIVDAVRAADREVNYMNHAYIMIVYAGDDQDRSLNSNDITSGGVYGNGYPISTGEGNLGFGVSWLAEMDPLGPYARYLALNFRLPSLLNPLNPLRDDYVAEWDLMGHGFWANNGSTPVELTSWCRIRLGWINESQLVEVNANESKTIDLDQLETLTDGIKAVKLPISKYAYYLIEVRRKIGYDTYLPDEGVLIMYVDEKLEQGQGIVRIVDSTPTTRTLNDASFRVGGIFENKTGNIAVEVLSQSNASCKVSIDRKGRLSSAYLTIDIPYSDVEVKIDGVKLESDSKNRVQKLVRIGSHVVEVPDTIYMSDSSRAMFNGWTDGNSTNPRSLTVDRNSTLTANYKLQNLLQVSSTYGSPTGSGWYDTNAVATFAVTRLIDCGNGTRRVFLSWTSDSNDSAPTSQTDMNKPKIIIAKWKTQYAIEFTTTGLKNGTAVMLTVNGNNKTYTVPFNYIAWFDEGSKLTFQVSTSSNLFTLGSVTYKFEGWTEKGKSVTSPITVTKPTMLTAVFAAKWPFPTPSDETYSSVATASWRTYLQIASGVLNTLSPHPKLFMTFIVMAYPFFAIIDFARELYLTLSFPSVVAVTGAVLVAGILLGLIYLFPASIVVLAIYRWKRRRVPQMRMLLPVVLLWVVGLVLVVVGTLMTTPAIEAIGVGGLAALVLATSLLSALIPSAKIVGFKKPSERAYPTKKIILDQPVVKEKGQETVKE